MERHRQEDCNQNTVVPNQRLKRKLNSWIVREQSKQTASGRKLYLHVELSEVVVQNPTGQTAETQVGAEASGTGIQRACVDPRVLKVGHPYLYREKQEEQQ